MPSLELCNIQVNVYPFVPSQDADAGNDPTGNYPTAVGSGVWSCVQEITADNLSEFGGRISVYPAWLVGFPGLYPVGSWGLIPESKIDVLAGDGVTVLRSIYTLVPIDGGGRGESWQVPCVERV